MDCPCCGKPGYERPDLARAWAGGHERALLRRLADSMGRWVTHATLIDAMWPDEDPPAWAKKIVHMTVNAVRFRLQTLGYTIENDRGVGYRMMRK